MKEEVLCVDPAIAAAARPYVGRYITLDDRPCRVVEAGLITLTVVWEDPEVVAEQKYQEKMAKIRRTARRMRWVSRVLYALSFALILRGAWGWSFFSTLIPIVSWIYFEFWLWPRTFGKYDR